MSLGFHRAAHPHLQIVLGLFHRRIEVDDDASGGDERPVHDEAEGAFLALLAEQHDGPIEVGIDQLRHRQQQRRREGRRHEALQIIAPARPSASRR